MIKFENTEIVGWEAAIRGMRNPMNSWAKSDSIIKYHDIQIGPNDLNLMKSLREAGTDHRKFMRMIEVYVDITAPMYWWNANTNGFCAWIETLTYSELITGEFGQINKTRLSKKQIQLK